MQNTVPIRVRNSIAEDNFLVFNFARLFKRSSNVVMSRPRGPENAHKNPLDICSDGAHEKYIAINVT